jgi:hypothetical protein
VIVKQKIKNAPLLPEAKSIIKKEKKICLEIQSILRFRRYAAYSEAKNLIKKEKNQNLS